MDQGVRGKFHDLMASNKIQVSEKDQFLSKEMVLQSLKGEGKEMQFQEESKNEECEDEQDRSSSQVEKGEEEILDFSISDKVDIAYLEKSRSVIIEKPNEEDQSMSSINIDQSKLEFS